MNIGTTGSLSLRLTTTYRGGYSHLNEYKDIGDYKIIDILNGSTEACEDMCDVPRVALLLGYNLDPYFILTPSIEVDVMEDRVHVSYADHANGQLYLRTGLMVRGRDHMRWSQWQSCNVGDTGWQVCEPEDVPEIFKRDFLFTSLEAVDQFVSLAVPKVRRTMLTVESLPGDPATPRPGHITPAEITRAAENVFEGSACTHEHDCCGCITTRVAHVIHDIESQQVWLHLERSRNY